jgi:AcrR family transcriptional regulator
MGVRERIVAAALECFSDEGYDRTTVARIREHAGVSNGAFFHHFPSKEAIADALYLDAMRSVQERYWDVLRRNPATLREAVGGIITAQLSWIEANPKQARFLYAQGHLDWTSDAGAQLQELNRGLTEAYREWLQPFVSRGEARDLSTVIAVAIVTGPAHAVAQRWLAGQVRTSLLRHADDLINAAVAGISGTPTRRSRPQERPAQSRVRVQLLNNDGSVVAQGDAIAELKQTTSQR